MTKRTKRAKVVRENSDYVKAVARMIRATGRRIGDGDPEDLALLVELADVLDAAITDAVEGQRRAGFSWADVARGLGVTRQRACARFGRRAA